MLLMLLNFAGGSGWQQAFASVYFTMISVPALAGVQTRSRMGVLLFPRQHRCG